MCWQGSAFNEVNDWALISLLFFYIVENYFLQHFRQQTIGVLFYFFFQIFINDEKSKNLWKNTSKTRHVHNFPTRALACTWSWNFDDFCCGNHKICIEKCETKSQNNSLKDLHENIVLCIKASQTKCKTQCALSNSSQKFYVLKLFYIYLIWNWEQLNQMSKM